MTAPAADHLEDPRGMVRPAERGAGLAWEAAAFPSGDVVLRRGPGAGLVLLEAEKVRAVVGAVQKCKAPGGAGA